MPNTFIILAYVFSNNIFANNKTTKTIVVDNEWQANFESKSLARWSYILHPQGISLLPPPNEPSNTSAYIEIKGDADYLWRGREDLNWVELQHKPVNTVNGSITEVSLVPSVDNNELWQRSDIKAQHWYSINLSITP